MDDFAKILSQFDQVVLMDIYPARELPIPGITSQALLDKIDNPNKRLISEKNFISTVEETGADLIVILGAGDIGVKVQKLKNKVLNEI